MQGALLGCLTNVNSGHVASTQNPNQRKGWFFAPTVRQRRGAVSPADSLPPSLLLFLAESYGTISTMLDCTVPHLTHK